MQVLVCGVIEPPKLSCPKSVHDDWAGKKLIPIALKQAGGTQKFRIPFMNESSKDLDIEFSFVKIGEKKKDEVSMNDYLEFFCMPGTLKMNAESAGILQVMVKLNPEKLERAKNNDEGKVVSTSLLKLLIAKVLETNMIYYFLFNVELVK